MISAELPPVAGDLLLATLAQAGAVRDTVITVEATATGFQYWVELLTGIASVIISLALIALSLAVIPAALNSRRFYGRVNATLDKLREQSEPAVRHANSIAGNIDYVTTAVRGDVERLQAMIVETQGRLDRAAGAAEERLADFNALLKVVQEEAESLFISTAATARGVRAGAETFRRFQRHDDAYDGELDEVLDEMAEDETALSADAEELEIRVSRRYAEEEPEVRVTRRGDDA